jgi:hypothetical protein
MPDKNMPESPTWDISWGYAAEMIAVFAIAIAVAILLASLARRRKRSEKLGERPFRKGRTPLGSPCSNEPACRPDRGGKLDGRQPKVAMPYAGC